jgi:hypothetical protein
MEQAKAGVSLMESIATFESRRQSQQLDVQRRAVDVARARAELDFLPQKEQMLREKGVLDIELTRLKFQREESEFRQTNAETLAWEREGQQALQAIEDNIAKGNVGVSTINEINRFASQYGRVPQAAQRVDSALKLAGSAMAINATLAGRIGDTQAAVAEAHPYRTVIPMSDGSGRFMAGDVKPEANFQIQAAFEALFSAAGATSADGPPVSPRARNQKVQQTLWADPTIQAAMKDPDLAPMVFEMYKNIEARGVAPYMPPQDLYKLVGIVEFDRTEPEVAEMGQLLGVLERGDIKTGKFFGAREVVPATVMSALGLGDGKLAAIQLADRVLGANVMAQIQKTKGAVSDREMAYFARISATTETQADAVIAVLKSQIRLADRHRQLTGWAQRQNLAGYSGEEIARMLADMEDTGNYAKYGLDGEAFQPVSEFFPAGFEKRAVENPSRLRGGRDPLRATGPVTRLNP